MTANYHESDDVFTKKKSIRMKLQTLLFHSEISMSPPQFELPFFQINAGIIF